MRLPSSFVVGATVLVVGFGFVAAEASCTTFSESKDEVDAGSTTSSTSSSGAVEGDAGDEDPDREAIVPAKADASVECAGALCGGDKNCCIGGGGVVTCDDNNCSRKISCDEQADCLGQTICAVNYGNRGDALGVFCRIEHFVKPPRYEVVCRVKEDCKPEQTCQDSSVPGVKVCR